MTKINFQNGIQKNIFIYFIFLCIAGIGILYGNMIKDNYSFLRVWEVQNILVLLIGIPFLFIQKQAQIPDFIDNNISNKNRFIIPVLIGMVFGLLDVFVIKLLMHPEPYNELPPFLQPFPYSIFLFFSGAFEIEVFYRLVPLTIFFYLGSKVRNGAYFNIFFWMGVILTSLREPLEQLPDGGFAFLTYSFASGFLMNYFQAVFFKKFGFLAGLTIRLGHYLFWHILLGIYVEFLELNYFN